VALRERAQAQGEAPLEDHAEEAYVVRKERPMSPLKIDSVPAAALAKRARDDAVKNGEFVK
jgi:hypothetical protein